MRKAIAHVGRKQHIGKDLLNDAAKGFFTNELPKQEVINHSNPTYMGSNCRIYACYEMYFS